MKPNQLLPSTALRCLRGVTDLWTQFFNAVRAGVIGALVLLMALAFAPEAQAQPYAATNTWFGTGSDSDWTTAGNWTNSVVPVNGSLVILTNMGSTGLPGTNGSGAVGTPNIVITNDTRIASLWVNNTNSVITGAVGYHTIAISNGATLTISNTITAGVTNIVQVTSQGGVAGTSVNFATDYGVNTVIYSTIQGQGGRLVVNSTNGAMVFQRGNIFVGQGSLGLSGAPTIDPLNAILDLSGLGTFVADVNHIMVGEGGLPGFFYNRSAGTIYLAKTNVITLSAAGNHQSASQANQGIMAGLLAQNNGGTLRRLGKLYLGETNAIYCNTGIGLGIRAGAGWIGFNPSNAPGTSSAVFRDRAGTGRQTTWAIGHRLNAGIADAVGGELDFSRGTVDALVGTLGVGVSGVANASTANITVGTVSFGAGIIDANTLQVGVQTASGGGPAQGTLNVSNTAVLKVNTSGSLGGTVGGLLAASYFGRMNITDGGSVQFANTAALNCGVGSSSEIKLLNGSSLAVLSIGSPAAPLTSLQISNSTLTVDRGVLSNPTIAPVVVDNLDAAGTNTLNVLGAVLVAGQFPVIKYTTLVNGGFTNFVLGSTSGGISGYLTNNPGNSTIDFVVTSSLTSSLTWDGRTNGVNVGDWDIGLTTNWQGAAAYLQASIPGSLVRFDDSAAGTTTVSFTNLNLSPADILVTNSSLNYTFTGSGALTGPGALTKAGTGTLVLSNTGTNAFTGGVVINGGTLQISGASNRLPTSAIVTFADAPATLDLNNLDQTVNALAGGGGAGGNVNLGTATLTIRSGGGNFAGTIGGAGALTKNTSGTQTLSGANTYSGGTTVSNAGLVVINSTGSGLGTGPVVIGTNGVLQIGNGAVDGSVSTATITNNGTLNLNPANSITLTQQVVGTGSLIKMIGSGSTVSITNANAYAGSTAIQQGIMQISHPNALGTGVITIGNQTVTDTYLGLSGNITLTNNITLSGKTGAVVPSPVGLNNLADTNTVSGIISLTGSTCYSVGSDAGKLIITRTISNGSSAAPPGAQFFLRGAGDGEFVGSLNQGGGATLNVEKRESGTWTFSNTNTYNGYTKLVEGKIVINGGLLGNGFLDASFGTTLAGSGRISVPVTNSGTIFPGEDGVIGTLSISNTLRLIAGDSKVTVDVSSGGHDRIRGLTTVNYGGTLKAVVSGSLTGNCIFKLFEATNYVGTFDTFDLPDISPLGWDTSYLTVDGTLHVTNGTPVTPAITSVVSDSPGTLTLSGTGTLVAPYDILTSTNLTLPLTNWALIGSGTFSNGLFNFTDTAATNVQQFYLLTTPTP